MDKQELRCTLTIQNISNFKANLQLHLSPSPNGTKTRSQTNMDLNMASMNRLQLKTL